MKGQRYIYVNGVKILVTEKVWKLHTKNTNRIHYQASQNEECRADGKKMAACNADCYTCPWWTPKGISVEERMEHNSGICGTTDSQMLMRCCEIVADMATVDPDGELIGWMLMNKFDMSEIASRLGIALSTCYQRIRRIGDRLKEE